MKQAWRYVALVSHNGFHSSCHSKTDGSVWTASPGASVCHCTEKLVTSLCCIQSDVITDFLISSLPKLKCFHANQGNQSVGLIKTRSQCALYDLYMIYLGVIVSWMLASAAFMLTSVITNMSTSCPGSYKIIWDYCDSYHYLSCKHQPFSQNGSNLFLH